MPYRFKVKGDSVGIFNPDGILVAIHSVPSHENSPPTGLDALMKAVQEGAMEGELNDTYAPAPSVSADSMMKELHDLPAGTSDATQNHMRNRACMRMFMEMANVNRDAIGTLTVNQNCHSAALLGHGNLLDLHSRFTVITETGRADDCPRLYMKDLLAGDDVSFEQEALRGRELNAKVLEILGLDAENTNTLKEAVLVNGHRNCTHVEFD